MDRALSDEALVEVERDLERRLLAALGEPSSTRAREAAGEAVPVLEALLSAASPGRSATDRHETLALSVLLGRRAATLGLSATATLALARTLVAVAAERQPEAASFSEAILACAVEGHVAGEVERVRREVDAAAADCVRAMALADRTLLVWVYASVGPDALEDALDAVARRVLEADAELCILVVTGEPAERDTRGFLTAIANLGAGAMMVGARVVAAIERPALRAEASRALPDLAIGPSLGAALELAGVVTSRPRKSLERLRDLFGRAR